MKILQMPCLGGACMKALLGRCGRFLLQDLVRPSPAAAGPFMTRVSKGSWHEDFGQGLLRFLVGRSCEYVGEIL